MSLATFKRAFAFNLLAILALLLPFHAFASTSTTTYTITDLTANDLSFACQANVWTASRQRTSNIYTKCGTFYILGGYNVLGGTTLAGLLSPTVDGDYYQRIYTDIPSHNLIQFSFTLFAIDGWTTAGFLQTVTSKFQLNFDTVSITGFNMASSSFTSNLCGGATNDLQPVYIYGTAVHSAANLTLQIVHQLGYDSAVASLGIRNLTLQFINTATTGSSSLCAKASITLPASAECACTAGQYKLSGTCTTCDSSCATCYGGTSAQCYTCASGYLFNGYQCILCNSACSFCYGTAYNQCSACSTNNWLLGNNTCVSSCNSLLTANYSAGTCTSPCSSTAFVMWDGSCSATCVTPLTQGNIYNVYKTCSFPCATTSYLFWNGTCNASCTFPLTSRTANGRLFCDYPCATSTDYLYPNGSCLGSCSSPYSPRTEAGKLYCDFLCPSYQHLYWNGSCITAACLSPLVERIDSVTGKLFCEYPCTTTQFLYWNGTCGSSCNSPLSTRIEGGRNFCDYPCTTTQYLYINKTCSNSCPSPMIIRVEASRQYCDYNCPTGQWMYWNGSCLSSCASPLTQRNDGVNNFCDYSCTINQYLYWNGTCGNACNTPLSTRTEGSRNFCDYPCATTGQYLYWNSSCLSTCASPLSTRTEASRQYCDFPCTTSQYLYWNGTCGNVCNTPLSTRTEGSRNFCDYPCAIYGQYLYWNSSCLSTCASPLSTRTEASRQYCDYSCATTQYLYWNATCGNNCASPLAQRVEAGRQYCDNSCPTGQFMYWNGSCLNTCASPLLTRTEATKQYCDFPCATTQYLYWNGTCGNACNTPLSTRTEGSRNFCDYPCAISGQYLYWNSSCLSTCASPLSTRTEASRQYCDYSCATSQYLYWNGTCGNVCNTPLSTRIESSRNFCDYSCTTGQFMYWNGTCLSSCASPLSTRTEATKQYCDFPCENSQYLYWNGTCSNDCAAPLSQRIAGGKQYCDYPCPITKYLFSDGTCLNSCALPLLTRVESSRNYCEYPCFPVQYLYWNGSCENTCSSPYSPRVANGKQYCDSACSGGFVYWNSSCLTSCDLPFIQRTTAGNQYCDFPCSTNQYLSWTGTCLNTCASPLIQRMTGGRQYCDYNCASNQYLYPNGTCPTSCSAPYVPKTVGTDKYCNPPCNTSAQYLYPDGSCQNFCVNPFVESQDSSGVKHCDKPCASNEYRILNGSCISSCNLPLVVKSEAYGNTCSSPCANPFDYYHVATKTCDSYCDTIATNVNGMYLKCAAQGVPANTTEVVNNNVYVIKVSGLYESLTEPGSTSVIAYTKMLNYIPFLDVQQTPRLQRLAESQTRPLLSFKIIPDMPNGLADAFSPSGRRLESVSSSTEKPLSFFVNYWGDLIFLMMAIALALVFEIVENFARDKGKHVLHALFSKLRSLTKWSFCVLLFATNIGDVILFAALEFSVSSSGGAGIASLIICVFTVIMTAVFLGFMFWLLRKAKQQRVMPLISTIGVISKAESRITTLPPKWNNFQVITRGIKDNTTLNRYFFFLYTVRAFLPMFLACCLYRMPVVQGAFQVLLSVFILGFIISQRPLKSTMNHIQLIIIEAITTQVNLCVFIFVILSSQGKVDSEFTVFVGDVIILGNIVINCVLVVFLVIKLTITVQKVLKVYNKSKGLKDKTLWVQLVVPFIQQTAFGFEELLLDLSNEGIVNTGRISPIRNTAENRTEGDNTNRLFIRKKSSEQMVVLQPASETDQSKIMGQDARSLEEFIPQFSPSNSNRNFGRAPSARKMGQAPQNNQPEESPTNDDDSSPSQTDYGGPSFGGGMPRKSIDTKDKMAASFIQKHRPSALLTASNLSTLEQPQSPGQNLPESSLMDSFSMTENNNSPATATKKLLNGRPSIFKRNNNLLNGLDESMRTPNSPGYSPLQSRGSVHYDRPMDKNRNRISSFNPDPATSIEIEDILGAGGLTPAGNSTATPRGSLLQTIKDQFNPTHRRSSLSLRAGRPTGGDSTPSRFVLKRNNSRSEQFE